MIGWVSLRDVRSMISLSCVYTSWSYLSSPSTKQRSLHDICQHHRFPG
jgi:hypothetical protein